jgi:acetolactate synthase-1/2/3 large subunit
VATGESSGLHMPDIIKVAKAIGLDTLVINDASELDDKIIQALNHPGPLICDVRMISDEALWPKVAAMPQADGSMISMPLEDMSPLLDIDVLKKEMQGRLSQESVKAR